MGWVLRKENWVNRFSSFLLEHENKTFKRGYHDCAIFAANGIAVITGYDFGESFRGLYKSKKQALELLRERGMDDLEAVATHYLGKAYDNVNFAMRGDCVLVEKDGETALGLVDLSGNNVVTTGDRSLVRYGRDYWVKAWRV